MATLDDVEQALAQAIASFVFAGQTYQLNAVANCTAPATGAPGAPLIAIPARVVPGSPPTDAIELDIKNGVSGIYISHFKGMSRNTTRFRPQHKQTSRNAATFTFAQPDDSTVIFGGVPGPNQCIAVQSGKTQYAYLAELSDTPASITAAFSAQIPNASGSGAVLKAPNVAAVRIAAWQSGLFFTDTTEQVIQAAIMATPVEPADGYAVRAALASCVYGLRSMRRPNGSLTQWIGLPDGSQARVRYHDEIDDDTPSRDDIWRRWVNFLVEYDTTIAENWPVLVAPLIAGVTNGSHIIWFGPGAPATSILTDGQGHILTDGTGAPLGSRA